MSESTSSTRFLKLDDETVNRLINAKLTAAQYRTFLYFALVDPFGNRPVETNGKMAREHLGISKSTYYDALARLQKEQLFDFEDVILRVRNKVGIRAPERHGERAHQPDLESINSDSGIVRKIGNGSESLDSSPKNQTTVRKIGLDSEKQETRSPDPIPNKASRSPHNLSLDLSTPSEKTEREKIPWKNHKTKKKIRAEECTSALEDVVNQSSPIDKKESAPVWTNFSAPGDDLGFFQFVLAKVKQLPQPPADNACVAEGWIQKQGHLLHSQYLAWKDERHRVEQMRQTLPIVVTASPPSLESAATSVEDRLGKYQAMWSSVVLRPNVETAIASHPEWGLEIGPDGPRLLEGVSSARPELSHDKMPDDGIPSDTQPHVSPGSAPDPAPAPDAAVPASLPAIAQMLPTLEVLLSDVPDPNTPVSHDNTSSPPPQEPWDGPSYAVG